jgi:hypothetical protein
VIAVMHDMMYAGPAKARVELMTKPISEVLHRGNNSLTYAGF